MNQVLPFVFLTIISFAVVNVDASAQQNSVKTIKELTVEKVAKILDDKDWVIVDTRLPDAFNGWNLDQIKRGGHLPGSVDFSASWLDCFHAEKSRILNEALRVKGIVPDKNIVLVGTAKQDVNRIATFLRKKSFQNLYQLDFHQWANDSRHPLTRYKNFHWLVPAIVVKQLLDGHTVETFDSANKIKFVEASWGNESASYSKGHVPRSFHVNTDHFEPPPKWMLGSPEILRKFAQKYGFQQSDTLIISGEEPMASYRLAVVLRYMGVSDVRVLNGGLAAWTAAKFPVETKSNPSPRAEEFGKRIPQMPKLILEIEQVKMRLLSPKEFELVDTRTWSEFIGEKSGYSYHSHKGRIPGSVYGQGDFQGENSLTPYRNIDNTMRNADEIKKLWKESGVDTETHMSFMCGSGWRAAEVLTFAQVMGFSNTSLYSDGWIRWSNDQNNPVESGKPK